MEVALKEAGKAAQKGEVPVGAVVVKGGKIISRGHNLTEKKQSALTHAEMMAEISRPDVPVTRYLA